MELILEKCKMLKIRVNNLENALLLNKITEAEYRYETMCINEELDKLEKEMRDNAK